MGFFSGSFGSGLLSGLVTSVDATLKSAIDQRNKDMSRARTFWETRQAQKIQRAEEHDTRAEKAIVRLANEFDGDFAKGLAAYKALGGDIDKVQAYIDDVDETRKINSSYSLKDKIAFDKIDLSQFGDVDKERAMKAIRMEVKPVSTSYRDTSGLARLGLGMDDASEKMDEKINSMFQSRLREDIEGLKGAIINREGLISSIEKQNKVIAGLPKLQEDIQYHARIFTTGINPITREKVSAKERYKAENNMLDSLKTLERIKRRTSKSTSGLTAPSMSSTVKDGLLGLDRRMGWTPIAAEGASFVTEKDLKGDQAIAYREEQRKKYFENIASQFLNEDGSLKRDEYQLTIEAFPALKDAINNRIAEITKPKTEDTIIDDLPIPKEKPPVPPRLGPDGNPRLTPEVEEARQAAERKKQIEEEKKKTAIMAQDKPKELARQLVDKVKSIPQLRRDLQGAGVSNSDINAVVNEIRALKSKQ
tara:strand:+ start:1498 stop:2928 length:1431 start_codon:yes stop_codon:yes gene_type:complete